MAIIVDIPPYHERKSKTPSNVALQETVLKETGLKETSPNETEGVNITASSSPTELKQDAIFSVVTLNTKKRKCEVEARDVEGVAVSI